MSIYSLRTCCGQTVDFTYQNNNLQATLRELTTNKTIDIVAGFTYRQISPPKLVDYLKNTYASLHYLSDGSCKLRIYPRLLGGMMTPEKVEDCRRLGIGDASVDDATVADRMLEKVPPNAYSSITVQTISYQFIGTDATKPTRQIDVKMRSWEWFVNVVKAIAAEPISGINLNRTISAILGSEEMKDQENLIKSYKRNMSFRVYVSCDLQNFYFDSIEDWTTSKVEGLCLVM